ncbi:SRPBCC family protein [Rhodococcus sp. SJ-3]|uniref:SRPBCC family protein n=1 Tax=Rhodococcus sp. SJ-3 TaxID=3454628 RepID=UPI003F78F4C1
MKLENTFRIAVPIDESWRVLLDIERVAPCVPGATITSHDGDKYSGNLKVKVGPIALKYTGIIEVRATDEATKVVVFEGSGREARGNGTASAVIACRMSESGASTDVFVETELDITGKPAQFGRGALAEVSNKLLEQFATNLADQIIASAGTSSAGASDSPDSRPSVDTHLADVEASHDSSTHVADHTAAAPPIDLLSIGGSRSRAIGVIVSAASVALMIPLLIRRRHRSAN